MTTKRVVCKRLKGLLVEHEMTIKDLSKKLGISENALMLKINGHRDFWFRETMQITRIFGSDEIKDVFPELYKVS